MPQAGFEPAIPARERQQTHTLDRSATGAGVMNVIMYNQYRRAKCCFQKCSSHLENFVSKNLGATLKILFPKF